MGYRRVAVGVGGRGAILLITLGVALAQVYPPGGYPPGTYPPGGYPPGGYPPGTYPPGTYPPGTYPGGRGPSIPIPSKGKSNKDKSKDTGQPMPNFRGKLKQMDDKSITLELGDYRQLEFKRTDKTKFFKNGEEVKSPKFAIGDQISVEGPEDQQGYMVAVNVYWEKAASSDTAKSGSDKSDKDAGVVDTWAKEEPQKGKQQEPAGPEASAEKAPPPAKPDAEDPGPPKLKRGKPADPSREHATEPPPETATKAPPNAAERPTEVAAARVPPPIVDRPATSPAETVAPPGPSRAPGAEEDTLPAGRRFTDPLIRKAADAALDFTEKLPSYVCQEMMSRYQSESHPVNWQPLDVVTANVVYDNGKEDYRDLAINGKPQKKGMEELSGAWSTGEFGTVLIDLFSPATAADFRFSRDSRSSGLSAKVYDFTVARENSHWTVHMASQTYSPAYRGSVWIDPQTARVLRIEMQAYGFPESFPTDHVESATDYSYVRLGDARQYLLPVHAETLSCQRGSNLCSRNAIDFRNYHKYTGESTITFEKPKE